MGLRRGVGGEPPTGRGGRVKETITVRLDKDVGRLLARVVKLSGRSRSDVVRDALRHQRAIDLFDEMRIRVAHLPKPRDC
jgi:predicted transcriptional regulator